MSNRREFIKNLGILGISSVVLPSFAEASKKVKNIGIQLYTFRKEMIADPLATLKQLSSLGIKQIESASSQKGNYYGLKPKEMKQICSDLGMTLRSGHVSLNSQWQKTMDEAAEAGQEYLICSSMPSNGQTISNYKSVAEKFNQAAEQCKKLNLKFGYHNHEYEFEKHENQVLYDVLLDHTDPKLVHMELDLGWVVASGNNPADYFKKYKGRFPLWHLKDMKGKRSTVLGTGDLDIPAILKLSKQSGLKYFFIEQEEFTESPVESIRKSIAFLDAI